MKKGPILEVKFYKTDSGNEPVREWLKSLSQSNRKKLGEDIKTVQYRYPVGMPLVESIGSKLWCIRDKVPEGWARIYFIVEGNFMILLHSILKKSNQIPKQELDTTKRRQKAYMNGGNDNEK